MKKNLSKIKKNILIYGPPRCGKSTLAKLINKKFHYNIISLDLLINGFKNAYPDLGIVVKGNNILTGQNFYPFLYEYIKALDTPSEKHRSINYCIEGVYFDFNKLLPNLNKEDFIIIGLTYNNLNSEQLLNRLLTYDTKLDWSYSKNNEEYEIFSKRLIGINEKINTVLVNNNVKIFDTSINRNKALKQALKYIKKEIKR